MIGGERGIRTLDGLLTHTPLAGERFRPLSQLSIPLIVGFQPDRLFLTYELYRKYPLLLPDNYLLNATSKIIWSVIIQLILSASHSLVALLFF